MHRYLVLLLLGLAACTVKPVRCDQHLAPINPPAAKAQAGSAEGAP